MRNITILGDSIAVVLYIVRCDLVGGDVCNTDWSWLVEIRIYMYQMRMKKIYIYSFKDIAKVFVNGSDIYTHTWKTFKNPLYTTYRRFNMHILCSDLPALWYNSIYIGWQYIEFLALLDFQLEINGKFRIKGPLH